MQNARPEHIPGYCAEVVFGLVTDTRDPEKRGRIKVKIPRFGEGEYPHWCAPRGVAYAPRGSRTRAKGRARKPALDAPVYITFLDGDLNAPLWEPGSFPRDKQPVEATENPAREVIYSSDKGNVVTENDRGDLELHAHGHRDLTVHSHDGHVKVESGQGTILLDATLDGPGVAREGDRVDLGTLQLIWAISPTGGGTIAVTWTPPAELVSGTPSINPVIIPASPSGTVDIPLVGRISTSTDKVLAGETPT
jgi:hypothetical protein